MSSKILEEIQKLEYDLFLKQKQLRQLIRQNIKNKYGDVRTMCTKHDIKPARIFRHLNEAHRKMNDDTTNLFKKLGIMD